MTPVRLEPAALRSRVKHSTTEPLRSRLCRLSFYVMINDFVTIEHFCCNRSFCEDLAFILGWLWRVCACVCVFCWCFVRSCSSHCGCLAFEHFLHLAMIFFAHFLRFQLRTVSVTQSEAISDRETMSCTGNCL